MVVPFSRWTGNGTSRRALRNQAKLDAAKSFGADYAVSISGKSTDDIRRGHRRDKAPFVNRVVLHIYRLLARKLAAVK
jgi:hypothetical protein